jgi:hypothetical protein
MKRKVIHCPKEFIAMAHSNGFIQEHRIVAAIKYGRILKSSEIVHHIDGNIENNSPDNLMVVASCSEHKKLHLKPKLNRPIKIKRPGPGRPRKDELLEENKK